MTRDELLRAEADVATNISVRGAIDAATTDAAEYATRAAASFATYGETGAAIGAAANFSAVSIIDSVNAATHKGTSE